MAIYMTLPWFWGVIFAGLVFWKDAYVEETKLIIGSYKGLTDIKDEL